MTHSPVESPGSTPAAPEGAGACIRGLFAAILLATAGGCDASSYGPATATFEPPEGWVEWTGELPTMAGERIAAWRSPAGSPPATLVVQRTPWAPNATAGSLVKEMRHLLLTMTGLRVTGAAEVAVAGRSGAQLECAGPGRGDWLSARDLLPADATSDGKGQPDAVSTRRWWLLVPGGPRSGTIEVLLHAPESRTESLRPVWTKLLATLSVEG